MAKIIALVGQKGGSGKSTTAINLASEMVRTKKRVLLVDADQQGTSITWGDVASEASTKAPTVVYMGTNLASPDQLPALAPSYDFVVIDSPPNNGKAQRAALMVADLAILPCGPSAPDAWSLAESVELVTEAQAIKPELKALILITRKMSQTSIGQGARDVLKETGLPVFKTELGYRVAYQEAPASGQGVTSYAPKSEAAKEIKALTREVLTRLKG